ncbi:MAG: NrdH-redoxin [Actinomycetota bacterium]|nr:NrdH-redoxin [Actinomycetota bacterium]
MRQLERAEMEFDVIDIEVTAGAVEYVMSVNGGNQTVPTVVLPDGGVLTNPSLAQLVDRLAA